MTELLPPDPLMWRTNITLSPLLYSNVCGGGRGGQKDEETFDSINLANVHVCVCMSAHVRTLVGTCVYACMPWHGVCVHGCQCVTPLHVC